MPTNERGEEVVPTSKERILLSTLQARHKDPTFYSTPTQTQEDNTYLVLVRSCVGNNNRDIAMSLKRALYGGYIVNGEVRVWGK